MRFCIKQAILMLLAGMIMFVVGISLSMGSLAREPLDYWVLISMRMEAFLSGGLFLLYGLYYMNRNRIEVLYEEIEKLKEKNEGDMSE